MLDELLDSTPEMSVVIAHCDIGSVHESSASFYPTSYRLLTPSHSSTRPHRQSQSHSASYQFHQPAHLSLVLHGVLRPP